MYASILLNASSFLSKFPKLKFIFSARPSTLIKDGELCKKALIDSRISFDELFTQLRQQGCDDISQIKYELTYKTAKKNDSKVYAVGDDWQSIYAFSGSRIEYIYNFNIKW